MANAACSLPDSGGIVLHAGVGGRHRDDLGIYEIRTLKSETQRSRSSKVLT